MPLNAKEQLMLELINRARLDPLAEAARQGIDLNADLVAGTLDTGARQVLVHNQLLHNATTDHAQWMLDTDTFAHIGAGGSSPRDRMEAAGYMFTPYETSGENIAYTGSTGSISLSREIVRAHDGLFKSAGHRLNILEYSYGEIGVSQVEGKFTSDGVTYNTSMVAQNFAQNLDTVFLTGVMYQDSDRNAFYSIGEGLQGVGIQAAGTVATSAHSGGYGIAVDASDNVSVAVEGASGTIDLRLDLSSGNGKLDLVNGTRLETSVSLSLDSANVNAVRLLGVGDLDVTGSDGGERLVGNKGDNVLRGLGGNDTLVGGSGDDRVFGGTGNDIVRLQSGNDYFEASDTGGDRVKGHRGNDTILAGDGDDFLRGHRNDDEIFGGGGDDDISGNLGSDLLVGEGGDDMIRGRAGNDAMYGQAGDDTLRGGNGEDTLDGGAGHDVVAGGRDADAFIFRAGSDVDVVTDYQLGTDRLLFSSDLWTGTLSAQDVVDQFAIAQDGRVVFDFGLDTLILRDVVETAHIADDMYFIA